MVWNTFQQTGCVVVINIKDDNKIFPQDLQQNGGYKFFPIKGSSTIPNIRGLYQMQITQIRMKMMKMCADSKSMKSQLT